LSNGHLTASWASQAADCGTTNRPCHLRRHRLARTQRRIRLDPVNARRPRQTGAADLLHRGPCHGQRFKLNLLTDDAFDSINYQASVAPSATWQTLHIPLSTFRATFRGREVPGAPTLDPARFRQVGLMISERQAGAFALEVRRIGLA
jgi:hypothetical protein